MESKRNTMEPLTTVRTASTQKTATSVHVRHLALVMDFMGFMDFTD
ncbi:hypothetical protein ABT147_27705 [Streptomyces sp. NPDC001868]